MKTPNIHKLVLSAMLAALTCVATMVVQIPSPTKGYVNLGDCFVLLSAWLLGPYYGAAAAGIGSMLTDLFMGYAYYAPATLVIKALMAFSAALIARSTRKRGRRILSGIVAELEMTAGYFLFSALLLGKGLAAALSVPGNLVQGTVAVVVSVALMEIMQKIGMLKNIGASDSKEL